MDNLMEKLSQKLGAGEIIRANAAAEAAETNRLKKQQENYQNEIAELKENASRTEDLLMQIRAYINKNAGVEDEQLIKMLVDLQDRVGEVLDGVNLKLLERFDESDNKTHDVGVRIYRNVQASFVDEQKKQTKEILDAVSNDKLEEKMGDEFKEMSRKIDTLYTQIGSKNNAVVPLSIISLLVSVATLVIVCLRIFGLF
ncbi:MAG: hypothetical protein K6B41_10115 [Butyrivibrio sp.]|nr:hypothetical protein [Butyrivibrio sp.]